MQKLNNEIKKFFYNLFIRSLYVVEGKFTKLAIDFKLTFRHPNKLKFGGSLVTSGSFFFDNIAIK